MNQCLTGPAVWRRRRAAAAGRSAAAAESAGRRQLAAGGRAAAGGRLRAGAGQAEVGLFVGQAGQQLSIDLRFLVCRIDRYLLILLSRQYEKTKQ